MLKKLNSICDYSQPDFYHFSEDSLFLAKQVSAHLQEHKRDNLNALELGAGCGVIGLEILQAYPHFQTFNFCEVQNDFIPYLRANIETFASKFETKVLHIDFKNFDRDKKKYDLIICNPPYFDLQSGRLPKDERRRLCRFMDYTEWVELLFLMRSLLSPVGEAFFLNRLDLSNSDHLGEDCQLWDQLGDVGLFRMSRLHIN